MKDFRETNKVSWRILKIYEMKRQTQKVFKRTKYNFGGAWKTTQRLEENDEQRRFLEKQETVLKVVKNERMGEKGGFRQI